MREMSNLPPGVTEGMIPGNRPEDAEWDSMLEWTNDQLVESGLDVRECRRAVLAGVAAVQAEKKEVQKTVEERIAEERMVWEMGEEDG